MLFHSATFLLGVTGLLIAYWATPWQRGRLWLLFAGSLVFYGWRHWPSILLLLLSIGLNYGLGRALERRQSKRLLALGVCLNVSALMYFKYAHFLLGQMVRLAAEMGIALEVPKAEPWAPLGISFFTFQVVAYLVDVYRKDIPAERDVLVFAVFKSFFAQLVAGPIVRGKDFLPHLHRFARFDSAMLHRGLWLVLCGYFFKVGVADVIGEYVNFAWSRLDTLGVNNAWLILYGYSAQLLADFWGYSTMAVGFGLCFGLSLPLNFDNPYRSVSLRDFWRRWHITLSFWLRDYLYFSLGGNRNVSKLRAAFNRVVTMALGGLWHGPGWNFVAWGLAHGVGMDLELLVEKWRRRWPKWLSIVVTFHLVTFLWVPFRAPSLTASLQLLGRLTSGQWDMLMPTQVIVLTVAFLLFQTPLFSLVQSGRPHSLRRWQEWSLAGLMLWFLVAYPSGRSDFIYFVF